ncbi:hypothetical protein MTBBW1_790051 [Desulfamplus magnetovallimortis]|uniref:Uncharacterized protein n=1 Tax=Desulfamplus magnetovallimortis TaxID=1246637 RepID=A0A1W1HJM5_9BACT|nr:hypothetical protein [Desulfamplus magnetovallimortis]SLM32653.1 hypothetical protein MTBBW1_790051 [Desulfamplus magnetovallimortis]
MNDYMAKTKKELVQALEVVEGESGVLKIELETLQSSNNETLEEIKQLHHLIFQLQEENINYKKKYSEAQNTIKQLKIDGQSALEQCKASHQVSMADYDKKLEKALLINKKLKDEQEVLNKEMENDRQAIIDFQKKNMILFNQINTLKDDNNFLVTQTLEAEKKNNALIGQLNNAKEEIDWVYNQMIELQQINNDLSLENNVLQDTKHAYAAVCNSKEAMFLLLDEKLDVLFVSDILGKRLHDNRKWEIKPLWNMISGIQEEKYYKAIQSVLIEKKQNKMKNIYLKISPLVFIRVEAIMFPITYNCTPAVKVVFNELG